MLTDFGHDRRETKYQLKDEVIKAVEVFSTWQGECVDTGKRMLLIRFKQCSRKTPCPFCDTQVKLRISVETKYIISQLQQVIDEQKLGLLCSGGEPTFEPHFQDTLVLLNDLNYSIANVETNGYNLLDLIKRVDPSKNVRYMYSPKIFKVSELEEEIERTKKLKEYEQVFIKLVYEDWEFINLYLSFLQELDINHRVFLMPEGATREDLIRNSPRVFDMAEKCKFNFSTRAHIIYGFI